MRFNQRGEETIQVLVADSARIHTQLLADALRRDPGLEVFSAPSDSEGVLEAASLHHFDVVVISSNLDEEPARGFEVLRQLRASFPQLRAVMLLDSSKEESILEAFRAGARGIFSRNESAETLCKSVRSVHQGQIWASSREMAFAVEALAAAPAVRAVDANGFDLLSKRELQVVRCLAEGLTNREIAERLGLSQHTIKNYLFRVFDKLGVSSRIELLFMTLSQASTPHSPSQHSADEGSNGHDRHQTTIAVFHKAAEEGLPGAQIRLAQMYLQGQGVPKDLVTAYMWYLINEHTSLEMKAAVAGAKRELADHLTADEILAAQEKASEYLKKAAKPSWHAGRLSNTIRMLAGAACVALTTLPGILGLTPFSAG
ncbi:MAG: LuxR C-terminal-related transcriptional regulator [Acidobacteriia bacterium]|nr:LuxR C-terminal-related transcriptional regulator [Terriglobia bacterium]